MSNSKFLLSMASIAATTFLTSSIARASLVSHWEGEGNTNDSVGSNHGVTNGNVQYTAGRFGQGFLFDGASYLDMPNPTSGGIARSNSFTLMSWFSIDNSGGSLGDAALVNLRSPSLNVGFSLYLDPLDPTKINFQLNNNESPSGSYTISADGFQMGVRQHVAISFHGGINRMRIYRNGVLANTFNGANDAWEITPSLQFQIGRNIKSGAFWKGMIDDVRYDGDELTIDQVRDLVPEPFSAASLLTGLWSLSRTRRSAKRGC